jgi:hypothetical protein
MFLKRLMEAIKSQKQTSHPEMKSNHELASDTLI